MAPPRRFIVLKPIRALATSRHFTSNRPKGFATSLPTAQPAHRGPAKQGHALCDLGRAAGLQVEESPYRRGIPAVSDTKVVVGEGQQFQSAGLDRKHWNKRWADPENLQ